MTDFNAVERELRDIDDDFTCGRMNAFGSPVTHEEILREMKKISELEIQVFFRTCEQISTGVDEESAIQRTLSEHVAASRAEPNVVVPLSPSSAAQADPAGELDLSASTSGRFGSGTKSVVRLCDASFAEIGKMFRAREAALRAVGDNLRQMSKHVIAVNEMVQRAHGASFGA